MAPNNGTSVEAASTQSKPLSELRDRAERLRLAHKESSTPPDLLLPKTVARDALALAQCN